MISIETTVYPEHRGMEYECYVTVEATVSHGGSNSYGSDEPAWTDVEDVAIYNSRGKRVSQRVIDLLSSRQWDMLMDELVEADASW